VSRSATVKRRRTGPLGRPLIFVVCPICRGSHWLPAADQAVCPRKGDRPDLRRQQGEAMTTTDQDCPDCGERPIDNPILRRCGPCHQDLVRPQLDGFYRRMRPQEDRMDEAVLADSRASRIPDRFQVQFPVTAKFRPVRLSKGAGRLESLTEQPNNPLLDKRDTPAGAADTVEVAALGPAGATCRLVAEDRGGGS
jgi:hypothetical protein